jgi:hypothetical protein
MYDFSDDDRLFTFGYIPAATPAAEIARHSQLSSCCQGRRNNGPAMTIQITPDGTLSSPATLAGRRVAPLLYVLPPLWSYLCTPDMRSASAKVRPPSLKRNSMVSIPVTWQQGNIWLSNYDGFVIILNIIFCLTSSLFLFSLLFSEPIYESIIPCVSS